MLDPHQLRIFLVAAETLNFSRAAERLYISQPSVTQTIQALENQLGAPLFVRSGRKLALTSTGSALLPLARQLVYLSLHTKEVIDSLHTVVHGHLRIGCSTTPGKYVLPFLLADFMRKHPHVQATCQVTPRSTALNMLSQGQVHLAVTSSLEGFDQHLEFRKFISPSVILITPLDHPWARLGEIDIEDLPNSRFILREETSGSYQIVRSKLAEFGVNITDLQTILTLGNTEAIAIAVQEGIGVGFVSIMVYSRVVKGRVAPVKIRGIDFIEDIYICRHRMQTPCAVQTAFWDYATQPDHPVLEKVIASATEA